MNELPPLAEGDTVDITIRGARVYALPDPEDDPGDRYWTFALLDANATTGRTQMLVSVPLDWPQTSVEHAGPEGWPPQVDDIWSDRDGEHWHALGRYGADEPVMVLDADAAEHDPVDVLAKFGPLRLVYRRDPSLPILSAVK